MLSTLPTAVAFSHTNFRGYGSAKENIVVNVASIANPVLVCHTGGYVTRYEYGVLRLYCHRKADTDTHTVRCNASSTAVVDYAFKN